VGWGRAGAFPSLGRARVLWLGVEDQAPTVRAQAVLAERLRAVDLRIEDRPYRPHLTLARLRSDLSHERADELKEALGALPRPAAAEAGSLVLYRSRLGRGRPSLYEELLVAPLA
jgi:2'-5' RNA ligase